MATISKARRKANPMKTKNDKVRLGNYSTEALRGMAEKADRKSTRLNSSHIPLSRMPSSA